MCAKFYDQDVISPQRVQALVETDLTGSASFLAEVTHCKGCSHASQNIGMLYPCCKRPLDCKRFSSLACKDLCACLQKFFNELVVIHPGVRNRRSDKNPILLKVIGSRSIAIRAPGEAPSMRRRAPGSLGRPQRGAHTKLHCSRFASLSSVPFFFCRGRGRRVFPFPPLRCRIIPLFLAASLLRLPFIFVPRSIQTCGDFCLHTTLQERGPTPRGPTSRGATPRVPRGLITAPDQASRRRR